MIKNIFQFFISKIRLFFSTQVKKIHKFNYELFNEPKDNKYNQILIENNTMQANHIAVSIFQIFCQKYTVLN